MRRCILLLVIVFAMASTLATVAYAGHNGFPKLQDGYDVTNSAHGVEPGIMPGTNVVATAATIDPAVTRVTFLWKNPAEGIEFQETVAVFTDGTLGSGNIQGTTYTNVLVKFAVSDYAPNIIGNWGVQALFQDSTGQTIQGVEDVVAIRATSFNVIPEIPILGAAGASFAMLAGFAFKTKRKNLK